MWELRNPIKSPLTILTLTFGFSFLSGVFGWGDDSQVFVIGVIQLVAIIWMWLVYDKRM